MSPSIDDGTVNGVSFQKDSTKKKKRTKTAIDGGADATQDTKRHKKEHKKDKKDKKKKKRHGEGEIDADGHISKKMKKLKVTEQTEDSIPDAQPRAEDSDFPSPAEPLEVDDDDDDLSPIEPTDTPLEGPKYPIFTRQISEYVAVAPAGFKNTFDYVKTNYLDSRLNNFVPTLKGVLVSYKNAKLSQYPDDYNDDADEPLGAKVIGDYGPAYCWLTYQAGLFMPKRGAWMEGVIVLEDSEHIGVQCWKLFNTFISARHLPRTWTWDANPLEEAAFEATENLEDMYFDEKDAEEENLSFWNSQGEPYQGPAQETGHWNDHNGKPVRGRIIRFRIKNFDAHPGPQSRSYLSIEGSLLSLEEEEKVTEEDLEVRHFESMEKQLSKWGTTQLGPRPPPPKGILKHSQE